MQSDRGGPRLELNATIYSLQSLHVWVTSKPGEVGEKKKGVTPSLGPTEERKKTVSPITETMRQEDLARGPTAFCFPLSVLKGTWAPSHAPGAAADRLLRARLLGTREGSALSSSSSD